MGWVTHDEQGASMGESNDPRTVRRSEQSELRQPNAAEAREAAGARADLSVVMANLARTLQRDSASPTETIQAIIAGTSREIAGVDSAGIILRKREDLISTAVSDSLAGALDRVQTETHDGPGVTALTETRTVRITDFSAEARWPAFTAEAMRLGVRSMLVLELYVEDRVLGVLNLYSMATKAFDETSESTGILFAAHAATALAGARQQHNLHTALASRDLIGQAKGILMERFKLTPDAAFALLVKASQATGLKLREVAYDISTTGVLPGPR